MAYLNPRFKEHVGSLCGTLAGETKPRPMGTCFFLQIVNSTGLTFVYLVTAKHVVENLSNAGGHTFLRINKGRVGEYNKGVIDVQIPIKDGWLYHADPSVDLAVLPHYSSQTELKPQKVDTYRFLNLKWESLFTALAKAPMWPPGEAEPVIFIAMTTQFQGERANLPTVRWGHLALVTDEPIKGEYGRSQYYVIEAQVYPGNSGAPVWVELTNAETKESGLYALGVLVFSYPAKEELKKVQGVENAYYNLGLSLVVPIEKVGEIVDSKEEKNRREKIKGPNPPGVAISAGDDDEDPFVLTREGFQDALRKVSHPEGKRLTEERDQASSET